MNLSPGSHHGRVGACVMEMVSLINGRKVVVEADGTVDVDWLWDGKTDLPACTTKVVARAAQIVNDHLDDSQRQRLAVLIPRLLRARRCANPDVEHRVQVRVALWAARSVAHFVPDEQRGVCDAALAAVEAWLDDPSDTTRRAAAKAAKAAEGAAAEATRARAATAARAAATAATRAAKAAGMESAAAAAAATTTAAAAATAAAWAVWATGADLVVWLSDLLDAHAKALVEEGVAVYDPEPDYLADDELDAILAAFE